MRLILLTVLLAPIASSENKSSLLIFTISLENEVHLDCDWMSVLLAYYSFF